MAPKRTARSPTGDSYGTDDESPGAGNGNGNGDSGNGKAGKETKKRAECVSYKATGELIQLRSDGSDRDRDQRKAQNRIAQREFRQRKVQYVRDLEARIALYESSKDDQIDQMKAGMRALIDENQQLRTLLAGVAGFVGDGIGGVLPQLAIDLPEFTTLIQRSRTDNVIETISSAREASKRGDSPSSSNRRSSSANATAGPSAPKRPRTSEAHMSSSSSFNFGHLQNGTNSSDNIMTNPYFLNTSSTDNNSYRNFPTFSPVTEQAAPYESPKDLGIGSTAVMHDGGRSKSKRVEAAPEPLLENFKPPLTDEDASQSQESILELFSTPTDNPKLQAIQLISYHMRNKRENPSYHLPPSLKATVTQQSVPHSPFFDGIIFASLRDRLILLKDQYDLPTLVKDLIDAFVIHEDDILLPTNWEISEDFLRKYWYVIDQEVLAMSNHWRRARGDPELTMRQLVPDGQDISAEGALGSRRKD